jgi:ABC-type branched-subunit amino acid transport system substrate-binding protein
MSPRRPAAAVLAALAAAAAPARAQVNGVADTEVVFGMCSPFSGPARELGRGMKTGIDVAFAATNEQGGVHGRRLRLLALDDGYEPERARTCMRELVEQRKVFAIAGNVGT